MIPLSIALDQLPTLGPHYDYWWTSPNFVMLKTSVLLLLLLACFRFEQLNERARTALRPAIARTLIDEVKDRTLLYAWHPSMAQARSSN